MEKLVTSNLKLGIISGGQLGKMLIQEASKWNIITYILDNDENCPAGSIASYYVKGSNVDFDAVYEFGKQVDILTFEIENINIEALKKLKSEGKQIVPDPEILEFIQDKGLQKEFYRHNNIPTSPFKCFDTASAIEQAIGRGDLHYPFVQKVRRGGYDGRGVAVVNGEQDLAKLLPGPAVVEDKVAIAKELSVIVARNRKGEIRCFPVAEMEFDHTANLVDKIICPASIAPEQSSSIISLAHQIAGILNLEGILAIEVFIDAKGEIIVNEMAPRTHNSGHHTIESIVTSQFEQHLRAVLNLPLGSTEQKLPAVMINILGDQKHEGPTKYQGLTESMEIEGVKLHLYGKKITKPYRKMGHATILASTVEDAIQKANNVKQLIRVTSWKTN